MKVVYLEFHTSALGWVKKMANDSGFQKVTKSKGYHKKRILPLTETTLWLSDSYVGRKQARKLQAMLVRTSAHWLTHWQE